MTARQPKKSEKKRGPKPANLAIEGPWEEAVNKALQVPPRPPPKKASTKGKGT